MQQGSDEGRKRNEKASPAGSKKDDKGPERQRGQGRRGKGKAQSYAPVAKPSPAAQPPQPAQAPSPQVPPPQVIPPQAPPPQAPPVAQQVVTQQIIAQQIISHNTIVQQPPQPQQVPQSSGPARGDGRGGNRGKGGKGGKGGEKQGGQQGGREQRGEQRVEKRGEVQVAVKEKGKQPEKALPTIRLITNMFRASDAAVKKLTGMVSQYEVVVDIIFLDEEGVPIPKKKPEKSGAKKVKKDEMLEIALEVTTKLKLVLASDGQAIMYTLGSLEEAINRSTSLTEAMSNLKLEKREDSIVLSVRKEGRIYMVEFKKQEWKPQTQLTQMLQVAVQFSFFMQAKRDNRKCFLPAGRIFLNDDVRLFNDKFSDLMLLRGIFESFRYNASNLPMVNIDVSYFPALRDDISLLDVLHIQAGQRRQTVEQMPPWLVRDMNEYFDLKHVVTTYSTQSYHSMCLLMEGKVLKTARTATFELRDKKKSPPRMISVYDYFTTIKGIPVRFPDQPIMIPNGKKHNMLLPELLRFKFGEGRALDDDEPSTMILMARNDPAQRFKLIDENAKKINNSEYWKQFGVEILDKYEVDGKILPSSQLSYSNAKVVPRDGTWNLDGLKFLDTPTGKQNWAVVYPKTRYNQTGTLVDNLVALARVTGYDLFTEPVWIEVQESYESYLAALKQSTMPNKAAGVIFYLIVLPSKTKERYRKIKELCHTDLGLVTQCVVLDHRDTGKISKMTNKSVLANILAGINAKLRYQNCIVSPKLLSDCLGGANLDGLLVMGLDVYHGDTSDHKKEHETPDPKKEPHPTSSAPPPKREPRPSIVALCAATNEHFTKYTFALRPQIGEKGAPVEFVQDLYGMVMEVMEEYLKGRDMPRTILFYRDGVGEKMYEGIQTKEIEPLMRAIADLCEIHHKPRPKLTFVIVPKRNHLRTLAPTTQKGNPPPGTLIDHQDVIDIGPENFYLYSHKALAGTAKPTHYIVVDNENNFSVLQLAEFTYALAHLHQGCTKSVSLPVPVYYADLACGVAGECFRSHVDTLDKNLKNTLFMI